MTEPVFREDSGAEVRYPLNNEQQNADRDGWPWLSGWVVAECSPDEGEICVQAPEPAIRQDVLPVRRAERQQS